MIQENPLTTIPGWPIKGTLVKLVVAQEVNVHKVQWLCDTVLKQFLIGKRKMPSGLVKHTIVVGDVARETGH